MKARVFRLAALAATLLVPAIAQIASVQIRFVEGEGAVRAPGRRVGRPLVVEVTDETGRPVAGASVTFHVPEGGPGGTFANGLQTEIAMTDAQGRAAMPALRIGRAAGAFSIRVVAQKEQARAGAVATEYADPAAPVAATGSARGKWLAIAAVVGGGMAAGVVSAVRRAPAPAAPAAPQPPPAVAVTIGTPTTTVGRP